MRREGFASDECCYPGWLVVEMLVSTVLVLVFCINWNKKTNSVPRTYHFATDPMRPLYEQKWRWIKCGDKKGARCRAVSWSRIANETIDSEMCWHAAGRKLIKSYADVIHGTFSWLPVRFMGISRRQLRDRCHYLLYRLYHRMIYAYLDECVRTNVWLCVASAIHPIWLPTRLMSAISELIYGI